MRNLLVILPFILLSACGNRHDVIDDLSDASFELVNEDNIAVTFPDDYQGKYVVMGFVYTNCPDICSLITQNLLEIQKNLNYPDDVQFVAATFDPERDTPPVLKKYGNAFSTGKNFDFLTGDSTQVFALMDSVRVRSRVSFADTTNDGTELYFINHSDKMLVIDKRSRIIIEYGGSHKSVPALITEDLNNIR